jgi:hypothetical protein
MTFEVSPNVTSSPGSASGLTPCETRVGPTTGRCGPDLAPAPRSRQQAKANDALNVAAAVISATLEKPDISSASIAAVIASPTVGTFGLSLLASSRRAALHGSLESRLRAQTGAYGSLLYKLTWRQWDIPLAAPICALRGSAARISGNELILSGWPTTTSNNSTGAGTQGREGGENLQTAVHLADWPTPLRADGRGRAAAHKNSELPNCVELAGWTTPQAHDTSPRGSGQKEKHGTKHGCACLARDAMKAEPARLCSDGSLLIGSTAEMKSGGQLSPAHSRWLMRLPPEWDACAPTATRSTPRRRSTSPKP